MISDKPITVPLVPERIPANAYAEPYSVSIDYVGLLERQANLVKRELRLGVLEAVNAVSIKKPGSMSWDTAQAPAKDVKQAILLAVEGVFK